MTADFPPPGTYPIGTAVVGAAIADAFGMRGLPNTVILEEDGRLTEPEGLRRRDFNQAQIRARSTERLIRQEHETQLECVPSAGQMNLF